MSPDALTFGEPKTEQPAASGRWDLPPSWAWVPLGSLVSVISRGRAPDYVDDGGTLVLNQKCIRWGHIEFKFAKRTSNASVTKYPPHLTIRDGDILWNSTGSGTIGRAAIYRREASPEDQVFIDTHITVVRCEHCLPQYLQYFAETLHVQKTIADLNVGSTNQLELPRSAVAELPIPLPPIPEQGRIVARIDELVAEIAEGKASLERARRDLDMWRRALLKAAVTGELTRDWRDTNRPAETGANLLARIRAERERPTVRSRRSFSAGPLDTTSLPVLPRGWAWALLGDLGEIVGGVTVDKKRKPSAPVEVPYLRVANVQRGYLDLSEVKSIRVERDVAVRLELKANDVLLNEGGDRDKIGRGWVWQGEVPGCIHQNHVFRVRLHEGINPYFVSHYANEMGRAFFVEKGKQTTNLASISLSKISELPVPVPPGVEASAILDRLSRALTAELDCRRELADARELARAQGQSILKAAFEGRLVPQDPADEPVTVLLARLRDENGMSMPRRRGRPHETAQGALAL
jgi:type I restriction enzyme S subunit